MFLRRKFSKQFLAALLPKFKEELFPPMSEILTAGKIADRLVYVRKGCLELHLPSVNKKQNRSMPVKKYRVRMNEGGVDR